MLPLDQVVFNTEAHAFPHFELGKLFKTGWSRRPRDSAGKLLPDPPKPAATEAEEGQKEGADGGNVRIQTVVVANSKAKESAEATSGSTEDKGLL